MTEAIMKIFRGDAEEGEFKEYRVPFEEGLVVLMRSSPSRPRRPAISRSVRKTSGSQTRHHSAQGADVDDYLDPLLWVIKKLRGKRPE